MQQAIQATTSSRLLAHLETLAGKEALQAGRAALVETEDSIALPALGLTAYVATRPEAAAAEDVSHNRNNWVVIQANDDDARAVRGSNPQDGRIQVRAFLARAYANSLLERAAS